MSWLTVEFQPGFIQDRTCWTTRIEREGELLQQVHAWPSMTEVTHRATLGEQDVAELARLVEAINSAAFADPHRCDVIALDTANVSVSVVERSQVRRFDAFDFGPALDLWHTVDRLSPRHLGKAASTVVDWRLDARPAALELRRLRCGGLDLDSALDHMRGRWFTVSAVLAAVIEVEGTIAERLSTLFEGRNLLDDF